MDLLGNMCRYVSADRVWVDEGIISTNMRLTDIEAQDVSRFPEWKEHVRAAVGQINVADISVKTLQQ